MQNVSYNRNLTYSLTIYNITIILIIYIYIYIYNIYSHTHTHTHTRVYIYIYIYIFRNKLVYKRFWIWYLGFYHIVIYMSFRLNVFFWRFIIIKINLHWCFHCDRDVILFNFRICVCKCPIGINPIYQPLRSGRIWYKVNFLAEFNRFEFRVFFLLD